MSIRQELVKGVFWSAIQKYSGILVQIAVTAVLARLLCPEDFGIIAVASVLISFFTLFTDMGIGTAIVQNQELSDEDLNSIFTFSIYGGVILSGLFFCSSGLIGSVYQSGPLTVICRLLSANLLFASWNIVPNALINKNKRFKFIALRTLGLQIICGIVAVTAAYCGLGMYALVISPVFTGAGVFILNYRQYPLRFTRSVDVRSLKKISSFSVYQFMFNFINYFSRNLDKLIIGKNFSMNELGYYEKSYRLMMLPLQNITQVITPVMHPVLTSLQNDPKELTDKYNKIVGLIATVSFPLGVFLYIAADELILLVFGDKWTPAIPVFRILALSVPLQMILSTTGAIYQSSGKVKWLFLGGLSNSCCTVTGFVAALLYFRSIEAMAWAWTITLTSNFAVSYLLLYRIVLRQPLTAMLRQLLMPATAAGVLSGGLYALNLMVHDIPAIMSFMLMVAVTGISIAGTAYLTHRDELSAMLRSLVNKRHK